ncbi:MAG: hypothetical protein KAG26_08730 [Methylococcales bacterium]|nr:hypothetical protein [Methylococcales bacterium]
MSRKLKNLSVEFISLVKKPANDKALILKGAVQFALAKTNDEMQRAYGIVYSPNVEDLQGDIADAETISKAQTAFMKDRLQKNIDTNHDFAKVDAFVAESWIVRKGDELFPTEIGAWAVGLQVDDVSLWKDIKLGDYTGISLAGTASVEPVEKEISSALETLRKVFNITDKTESNEMDEKQVFERLEKANKAFHAELMKEVGNKFFELQKANEAGEKSKELEAKFSELQKALTQPKTDEKEVVTKADLGLILDELKEMKVQLNKKGDGETGGGKAENLGWCA